MRPNTTDFRTGISPYHSPALALTHRPTPLGPPPVRTRVSQTLPRRGAARVRRGRLPARDRDPVRPHRGGREDRRPRRLLRLGIRGLVRLPLRLLPGGNPPLPARPDQPAPRPQALP